MTQLTCPVCGFLFTPRIRAGEIDLWCEWCQKLMKRETA